MELPQETGGPKIATAIERQEIPKTCIGLHLRWQHSKLDSREKYTTTGGVLGMRMRTRTRTRMRTRLEDVLVGMCNVCAWLPSRFDNFGRHVGECAMHADDVEDVDVDVDVVDDDDDAAGIPNTRYWMPCRVPFFRPSTASEVVIIPLPFTHSLSWGRGIPINVQTSRLPKIFLLQLLQLAFHFRRGASKAKAALPVSPFTFWPNEESVAIYDPIRFDRQRWHKNYYCTEKINLAYKTRELLVLK